MRTLWVVVAAMASVLSVPSIASADTFNSTPAWTVVPPSLAGTGTGSSGTQLHTFKVGGNVMTVTCRQQNFFGTIVGLRVAETNMEFPGPGNPTCVAVVFGLPAVPATVTDACDWTLAETNLSYNASTGASQGTLTTCGTTTISVPALSCTVTLSPTVMSYSGRNLQNGVAGPLPSNQLRVTVSATGVNWNSPGCPPFLPATPPTRTDASYSGVSIQTGLWVQP